jgi:hypothetical protein
LQDRNVGHRFRSTRDLEAAGLFRSSSVSTCVPESYGSHSGRLYAPVDRATACESGHDVEWCRIFAGELVPCILDFLPNSRSPRTGEGCVNSAGKAVY